VIIPPAIFERFPFGTEKRHQMQSEKIHPVVLGETLFKRKLLAWCRWVKIYTKTNAYIFAAMVIAANTRLRHLDGIISFAADRVTNAFMEGLNSVFSAVKRTARGFRSTDNLITMLYFVSDKLNFSILD
jgi:transposase